MLGRMRVTLNAHSEAAGNKKIGRFYIKNVHTRSIPDYPYDPYTIRSIWSGPDPAEIVNC